MTTIDRLASSRRWLRVLPWVLGLAGGAAAHLVWWAGTRPPEEPVVRVISVETQSPAVHVHVHGTADGSTAAMQATADGCHRRAMSRVQQTAALAGTASRKAEASAAIRARHSMRTPSASGALVCSDHGCTIRRSFLERLVRDPGLLGEHTRVLGPRNEHGVGLRIEGVFPGSVADLLGLRSGDILLGIDGQPLRRPADLLQLAGSIPEMDGVTMVLLRHRQRQAVHHRVIDG